MHPTRLLTLAEFLNFLTQGKPYEMHDSHAVVGNLKHKPEERLIVGYVFGFTKIIVVTRALNGTALYTTMINIPHWCNENEPHIYFQSVTIETLLSNLQLCDKYKLGKVFMPKALLKEIEEQMVVKRL